MKALPWIRVSAVVLLAACGSEAPRVEDPADAELPAMAVTLWSGRTELFMEHAPLIEGENSSFAVHLTDLRDFRPLSEGRAALLLEREDSSVRFESGEPSSPGIFRIDVTPKEAGRYRGVLTVRAPGIEDSHALGEIVVHASRESALEQAADPGQDEAIQFLKEQQWSSEFATEAASTRVIEENLLVPAVVRPRGGAVGSAVSPVTGRLMAVPRLPVPGERVREGQVICAILPFTATPQDPAGLSLEVSQAETDLSQARLQLARLERLLAERAVPARRVEEARAEEARAEARLNAARERLAQFERTRTGGAGPDATEAGSFQVKAPIGGIVTELSVVAGGAVEAGREILRVIATDRVWVEAQVAESDAAVLRSLRRAELRVPGHSGTIVVPGGRGRIAGVGSVVDPESRRIPVILDVQNRDGLLRIGQSLEVSLSHGAGVERVSVPVGSIVDDGGLPVVFVQTAGESFRRSVVRTGPRAGGYVHIIEGIRAGDRVVSRGAYLIRLAALSTQMPAHGHVH